uniref:Uncharacterized protein n=1 Tax=Panagrolaimus sp. JU765 TaxID=591449 RepID=A0AC34RBM1_9BILA
MPLNGTVKDLIVERPTIGRKLGETTSRSFKEIVEENRKARDLAFWERYESRKQQELEMRRRKTEPLPLTTDEPQPSTSNTETGKRKPRAYIKDKVKTRTKELVESFLAPFKDNKPVKRTESQRMNGLAIVAPSNNSTTDKIILGGVQVLQKTRSGWLDQPKASNLSKKSAGLKRLSFVDESGKLKLPFMEWKKPTNDSVKKPSSFRSRVMGSIRNGPFSKSFDAKMDETDPDVAQKENITTSFKKRSRSKLALDLFSGGTEKKTSSETRPLETPTDSNSPPIAIIVPTPPAEKTHDFSEILRSIAPPATVPPSLLHPPNSSAFSRRSSFLKTRLYQTFDVSTSANEYTTAEEGEITISVPSPETVKKNYGSLKDLHDPSEALNTGATESKEEPKKKIPGVETGSLADIVKRRPRKYVHSHTTATYDPSAAEKVADASERRRLIGVSTSTDNITSVSRQHNNYRVRQRRMRRHLRQPSRASSMSSMTETSMSLEVMTVTLNMDSVNFLGISIVGQSSTGGDNGIYVANIMKGGAVALDGRIEPGDMILQVNDVSFENFTNDQAVEVLKEAVSRRGPIKLTVAKSWDSTRQDFFALPTKEPVRPIDMRAWIQHTNAANNLPHIPEGSEGAPTPIPGQYPNYGRAHSHRRRAFEDSTICTESDAKVFSDDESRVSTSTDNITSVSRQHNNYRVRQRRMRRHLRQPSRASSMSSMTETSMSLEVMTVTLNMDSVNFLGISIVGQSSTGGDNGIYVANIMKGGAVALDGRIEPGDMILQVNDVSFENFTNDQAVEVLKEAVSRRGPIKLTVAKSWDSTRQDFFALPTKEPVRPIDMRAWIQHTNAANNLPHIPEGSEGAPTPIPGQYPNYGRAHSSSTATSNGSGQQTIIGPNGQIFILPKKLDTSTDKKRVVCAMALPNSGLEIKDRTWLEILFPMSFLGSDLIDWLMTYVEGLNDRKDAKKYAADLLKEGHITHMVNDKKFNKQSYYMIGPNCADVVRLRLSEESTSRTDINSLPAPPPTIPQSWQNNAMVNNRHLLPPSGTTPNSARKASPVLNSAGLVPRSSGAGAFPTANAFSADNSIYGVVPSTVPAPPPSTWRLTEDLLGNLKHMGDV